MLKTCCECIASFNSAREDNDTYGVRMNRDIQNTMWPTLENEDIYKLPKILGINNSMTIQGTKSGPIERILFSLRTDNEVAFKMEIDFIKESIMLWTPSGESAGIFNQRPSDILNSFPKSFSASKFILNVQRTDETLIDIILGVSPIDTIELDKNTLDSITQFTLSKDVIKVEELIFKLSD